MSLHIRFQYITGASLKYSVEQLSTGLFYDFTSGTFVSSPSNPLASLPELASPNLGLYSATPASPSNVWTNGDYSIPVHDAGNNNNVVDVLAAAVYNGSDATVFPSGAGTDPLSVPVPGAYPAGTVGYLIGNNLVAPVGGPVQSVTNPVVVGTNNDKSGYILSSSGVDNITCDGNNLRQAIALIQDVIMSYRTGVPPAGQSGTVTVKNLANNTTRATITLDGNGNITGLTLNPPP